MLLALVDARFRKERRSSGDLKWLRIAARIAQRSRERMKHGAVLVSGGRLISWGFNQNRLDPYYYGHLASAEFALSIHAEEAAIRRVPVDRIIAGRRGVGVRYTLYVVRVNARGHLMFSAPCDNCSALIHNSDCPITIKRVCHS